MNNPIQIIPISNLVIAFLPVLIVIAILWKWGLDFKNSFYAMARMLLQLFLIGFFLIFIFKNDNSILILGVLSIMLLTSSWIALRTVKIPKKQLYLKTLASISLGGILILFLVSKGVLNIQPWYSPSKLIPLAGMIFANAMNSVSLAAERIGSELNRDSDFIKARNIAFKASLIPITNSLFAVGLVSLPGMMTGQILSGVSPFIASRYQIMVMCMVYASAGISSALFLTLTKLDFVNADRDTK